MGPLDWGVFAGIALLTIFDGVRRGRQAAASGSDYLLAGRQVPWWAMGLSVMATQASAITLVSTFGLGAGGGTRFVQFYYGMPIALLVVAFTAVPFFHRERAYTAYGWLERRFGRRTRTLVAATFLVNRCLSAGFIIYAPAVVLRALFDVPLPAAVIGIGAIAVLYTTFGGLSAVIATDVKQMGVIVIGLVAVAAALVLALPPEVGVGGALRIGAAAGRLTLLDPRFDPAERYNVWSALLGGTFLFLAYFGTDQSQVQRYLAGRSLGDKRAALLMNAVLKVPFQLGILLLGVLLSVLLLFEPAPLFFEPAARAAVPAYEERAARHDAALKEAGLAGLRLLREGEAAARDDLGRAFAAAAGVREEAREAARAAGLPRSKDGDYALTWFATRYLPAGVLGLLLAAILAAALSSIDSELNSMATVAVTDLLRLDPDDPSRTGLVVRRTRQLTVLLGALAGAFALWLGGRESIVEGVNIVGSVFYGAVLGVFVLAAADRGANGAGAAAGLIAGVAASLAVWHWMGGAFLWMNTAGTLATVAAGAAVSRLAAGRRP